MTKEYLKKQHKNFMQTKSQDTVIVPVMYTGKAMGKSKLTEWDEEDDDGMTHFDRRDVHSDEEEYDKDSPVGYRDWSGMAWVD